MATSKTIKPSPIAKKPSRRIAKEVAIPNQDDFRTREFMSLMSKVWGEYADQAKRAWDQIAKDHPKLKLSQGLGELANLIAKLTQARDSYAQLTANGLPSARPLPAKAVKTKPKTR